MQAQSAVHSLPPQVQILAAPPPHFIDNTLPTYLQSCMLSTLRESTRHAVKKRRAVQQLLEKEGLLDPEPTNGKSEEEREAEEVEEGLRKRMSDLGQIVGGHIAERLTVLRPPMPSPLDTIKFICKEFFLYVYSRQIDNLRTNHRGVFVLQYNTFPPLLSLSTSKGSQADLAAAKIFLVFPPALIQGALGRLGMVATVSAESSGLPQCTFNVKSKPPPGLPPAPGDSRGATPVPRRAE